MPKIELDIIVEHRKDGLALPKTIIWDDGRCFDIDRVLDIRKAAATKCGGRNQVRRHRHTLHLPD